MCYYSLFKKNVAFSINIHCHSSTVAVTTVFSFHYAFSNTIWLSLVYIFLYPFYIIFLYYSVTRAIVSSTASSFITLYFQFLDFQMVVQVIVVLFDSKNLASSPPSLVCEVDYITITVFDDERHAKRCFPALDGKKTENVLNNTFPVPTVTYQDFQLELSSLLKLQ